MMPGKLKQISIIGAFFAITGGIYGCGNSDDAITASELAARIEAGAAPIVLDVRTAEEYAAEHIPGAINISHLELRDRLSELDGHENDEIVVHCGSGGRAALAEAELRAAGYTHVRDLEGHMQQWQQDGYRLELINE